DWHFAIEVTAFALEKLMLLHRNLDVKIAAGAAIAAGFALTGKANAIACVHAWWHFNVEGFGFFDTTMAATVAAGIGDDFAFPATGGTGLLYREKPLLHAHLAVAATGGTGVGL